MTIIVGHAYMQLSYDYMNLHGAFDFAECTTLYGLHCSMMTIAMIGITWQAFDMLLVCT